MGNSKKDNIKQQLFDFMEAFDDEDAPDGAWQAMLEDAVNEFNESQGTTFDSNDMFLEYVQRNADKKKQ